MQFLYVLIATCLTFAGLIYVDDNRRRSSQKQPTPLHVKAAIFFSLLLLFFGIFYWMDEGTASTDPVRSARGGGATRQTGHNDTNLVKCIKEDCHPGIAPF
jgi:hypothetical protein